MTSCDVVDKIKNELDIADEHQGFYENNILNDLEIKIALDIDILLELIFDRNISKTLNDAFVKIDNRQTPFWDNGKFLYLPVSVIEITVETSGTEISLPTLYDILTENGYKSEGWTPTYYGSIAKDSRELAHMRWKQ